MLQLLIASRAKIMDELFRSQTMLYVIVDGFYTIRTPGWQRKLLQIFVENAPCKSKCKK